MQRTAFALASSLALAHANVVDQCQMPAVQQNFDIEAYLGLWYEQRRDQDCRYEQGICDTAQYSLRTDGNLRVLNSDYDEEDGKWVGGAVVGKVVDPDAHEGYLQISIAPFLPGGDYKILSTDYTNYTVLYSCTGREGLI